MSNFEERTAIAEPDRSPSMTASTYDFSHLMKTDAVAIAAYLKRHDRASDEMYLEALRQIDPPLALPDDMHAELYRQLTPEKSRRGRPRKGAPTRVEIAEALEQIDRDDVPSTFRYGLGRRLRKGEPFTKLQRAAPHFWAAQ